ncbi:MAG: phenylacetate--CoA ligase family protein [Candidatus Electrothrix sp. AUS4]|nr:phenylacetate--CoA ligase family protein [Candidatus Electrothrix sp. AUS4]
MSAFSYSLLSMQQYRRKILNFKAAYFYGYVSMIEEYAKYIKECEHKKILTHLKAIITTSEVLHDSQRKLIEDVFHTKVYNEYGCGEVGTVAHECECGNMHISAENMIVEILDGDRPCEVGELGEIVVTELNNTAFPLIRYRLGDFGALDDKSCPCGKKLPILKNIQGRAYDTIQSSDGRRFHGEFFMYIFEEAEKRGYGVAKFQVVQVDLQTILIKIVPSVRYQKKSFEHLVTEYIRGGIEKEILCQFEIVNDIPREKSGKLRLIIGMR